MEKQALSKEKGQIMKNEGGKLEVVTADEVIDSGKSRTKLASGKADSGKSRTKSLKGITVRADTELKTGESAGKHGKTLSGGGGVRPAVTGRKRSYTQKAITTRELAFIKYYTTIGSDTYNLAEACARKAGYVEKFIEQTAERLLHKPEILEKINERYAARLEMTPANISRIMSSLDHAEAIALKSDNPAAALKGINDIRMKYVTGNPDDSEKHAEKAARMSEEDKRFHKLVARILCDIHSNGDVGGGSHTAEQELRRMICANPGLVFPPKIRIVAGLNDSPGEDVNEVA